MNTIKVSIIVPVFNEADAIPLFLERVNSVLKMKNIMFDYIFINDGSDDFTLEVLKENKNRFNNIKIIDLSRNFGKEAALSAGLYYSESDAVIPIDVDLQDPPELIPEMISIWQSGYEVVLCKRSNRNSDTAGKRIASKLFYFFHNLIADQKIPNNVGDFRLLDRSVVNAINQLPESRRFMKGIFAWIGFKTKCIDYVRQGRSAGKTKFNGIKLWNFAIEAITSFSTMPLRLWTYVGAFISTLSFVFAGFIVIRVIAYGVDIPGYSSLMVAVTFLGGLQLIGIGVIGEYLGRTYIESKRRPIFVVRKVY